MSDVLAEIVAATQARVAASIAPRESFSAAIRARSSGRLSIIAEHKRASPSAGTIRDDLELREVVTAYERGGAAALSILTEPDRFGGRLEDVVQARQLTQLPIIRKDFIVTDYQVYEAAFAGADAILLIVAAFPDQVEQLAALQALAGRLGLEVLMEVHDRSELDVALELEPPIVGINNRNLATLQVDIGTTLSLRPSIPAGTIVVAESGFRTRAELERLADAGVDAVLIGEALMRAPDVEAACRELTGAPTI